MDIIIRRCSNERGLRYDSGDVFSVLFFFFFFFVRRACVFSLVGWYKHRISLRVYLRNIKYINIMSALIAINN